ncbi:MAG: hypothetical protein WCI55_16980, partial [Armatimonadota bacterium]
MKKQLCWLLLLTPILVSAQGTKADYDRANGFREKFRGLVLNERIAPNWIGNSEKFWYMKQGVGGTKEFILVDPLSSKKAPAFDHKKVAEAVTKVTSNAAEPDKLPFNQIDFTPDLKSVLVRLNNKSYAIDLKTYEAKESSAEIAVGGLKAFAPEEPPRAANGDATS